MTVTPLTDAARVKRVPSPLVDRYFRVRLSCGRASPEQSHDSEAEVETHCEQGYGPSDTHGYASDQGPITRRSHLSCCGADLYGM